MDQKTRKLITMHKALHPRDTFTDYVSKKEVGRGFHSIEDSDDASKQRLEDYIENRGEGLITVNRNDTNNTKTNRMAITKQWSCRYCCMDAPPWR